MGAVPVGELAVGAVALAVDVGVLEAAVVGELAVGAVACAVARGAATAAGAVATAGSCAGAGSGAGAVCETTGSSHDTRLSGRVASPSPAGDARRVPLLLAAGPGWTNDDAANRQQCRTCLRPGFPGEGHVRTTPAKCRMLAMLNLVWMVPTPVVCPALAAEASRAADRQTTQGSLRAP